MSAALTRGHDVHPGTVWVWREPTERWSQYTCSFCGSVRPLDAAEWLERGNEASGSEWKYGWPHKFYVSDNEGKEWKFYSEHLTELGPESFARVSEAIASTLRIRFVYDPADRMFVKAPEYGYQTWVHRGVEQTPLAVSPERTWEAELTEEILGG
jgi:hypothetical protein